MTPEGRTKAAFKRWHKDYNLYGYWPVPTGYGAATLDYLGCWNGLFVGIEFKREGVTKPTPWQAATMKAIRAAGGRTYLVTMEGEALKWIEIKDAPAAGSGS